MLVKAVKKRKEKMYELFDFNSNGKSYGELKLKFHVPSTGEQIKAEMNFSSNGRVNFRVGRDHEILVFY